MSDYPDFCPGLPVTGELDRGTLQLMRTPRCGVKDDVGTSRGRGQGRGRGRRFALQGGHTAHTRQELLLTILWARLPVECPHPAVQDLPLPHLHHHDPGPGGHDVTLS